MAPVLTCALDTQFIRQGQPPLEPAAILNRYHGQPTVLTLEQIAPSPHTSNYYSDIIWESLRLTSPVTGLLVQCVVPASNKEIIKWTKLLVLCEGTHRLPVDSHHKGLVARTAFLWHDVFMASPDPWKNVLSRGQMPQLIAKKPDSWARIFYSQSTPLSPVNTFIVNPWFGYYFTAYLASCIHDDVSR